MGLAAMQRELTERADIAAVPAMSLEERATKRAEYKAKVDQLASEERQAFAALPDPGSLDSSFTGVHVQQLRAVRAGAREHRAAQRSLKRLEREIAKAEHRTDRNTQDAFHSDNRASQSGHIRHLKTRTYGQ